MAIRRYEDAASTTPYVATHLHGPVTTAVLRNVQFNRCYALLCAHNSGTGGYVLLLYQ